MAQHAAPGNTAPEGTADFNTLIYRYRWLMVSVVIALAAVYFMIPQKPGGRGSRPSGTARGQSVTGVQSPAAAISGEIPLSRVSARRADGHPWRDPANIFLGPQGVTVDLGRTVSAAQLEISCDNNDRYALTLLQDTTALGDLYVEQKRVDGGGLSVRTVTVSPQTARKGYNKIHVRPVAGDNIFILGHIAIVE